MRKRSLITANDVFGGDEMPAEMPLYMQGYRILDGVDTAQGAPYLLRDLAGSPVPIDVWCDGSCSPKTGRGGAGAVIVGDVDSGLWELSVHVRQATSTAAEWIAVEMALWALEYRMRLHGLYGRRLRRPVRVHSDCQSVVKMGNNICEHVAGQSGLSACAVDGPGVLARHMEQVHHSIDHLVHLFGASSVSFEWVKSRSGLKLHDAADKLAREASDPDGQSVLQQRWYFY